MPRGGGTPYATGHQFAGKDGRESMFFWKKQEKWHEVRWFAGPRDIYLAVQFVAGEEDEDDDRGGAGGSPTAVRPKVERLSSKDPAANVAQPPLDEGQIADVIETAVAEYNRKNRFHLRVAGIRFRAKGGADVADHGSAARKLLNLL
jgi:hypothetical protein